MRIAIVRLSALGDIVQTMIVVQFIKNKFPDSQIDWFVDEKFKDILKNTEGLSNIFGLDINKIKRDKSLRSLLNLFFFIRNKGNYDIALDFQGLIKSALITRFIKSKKRCGFDKNSLRERLASYFYNYKVNISYSENVIFRYVELVNKSLNLKITKSKIDNKKAFYKYKKTKRTIKKVILVIGASFDSKIYPIGNYKEIFENLDAEFIVIWKTKKEKEMAVMLARENKKISISSQLSLVDLVDLIAKSDLVIGGDTGPTHLAWALNIPSIILFGPTSANRNTFQTDINIALSSSSHVNPYKINKKDYSIGAINPKKIIKAAKKIL